MINNPYVPSEKIIKKARKIRKFSNFINILKGTRSAKKGKEFLIQGPNGTIRTLLYGFDSSERKPVYFDLHGGGFILMSADADDAMNAVTSQTADVKIVSIDYAKAPEHPFPAGLNEVYYVVKYFYERADEFMIDSERMAIGGHSAGANLATVTCLLAKERQEFRFRFQILDYPPLDLAKDAFSKPYPKGAIPPKMAHFFNTCYVSEEHASHPHVSPIYATNKELSDLPKALVIVAGIDSLYEEGKQYAKNLADTGVDVTFHEYLNAAHGFTYEKGTDSEQAREIINTFIRENIH